MKALTLRRIDSALARAIEKKAHESGTSLSGAVVTLLEQAAGLSKRRTEAFHDLDHLAGSWSKEQARAFDNALGQQRTIDPELWA